MGRFRVVLDDAAHAAWSAVSGTGQRNLRRLLIRFGSLRRLVGPLHAPHTQPAATTLGVAAADRSRRGRHGGYGSASLRLGARCAAPNGVEHLRWYDYPLAAALRTLVKETAGQIGQSIPDGCSVFWWDRSIALRHSEFRRPLWCCCGAGLSIAQRCGACHDEFHEQHVRCGQSMR